MISTRLRLVKVHGRPLSTVHQLTRFEVVPEILYRVNLTSKIKLRSYEQRISAGMTEPFSYDLHEVDGLVHPVTGSVFTEPNGMSLRAKGEELKDLLSKQGDKMKTFVLPAGLRVPSNLILVHEYDDHYSMQVKVPMTLNSFNSELSALLKSLKCISKGEALALYEDDDEEEESEAIDN